MGEIPTELNNLDLYFLKLNNNQFSGTIPYEFCDIDYLDHQIIIYVYLTQGVCLNKILAIKIVLNALNVQ